MKKSNLTTLCYLEKDGCYLMMHRVRKKQDVNEGKWIGVGGHFELGESPEDCLLREVKEETGLTLTSWKFRGLVTFTQEGFGTEYMCLYTAEGFQGEMTDCEEGCLEWVRKERLNELNLWDGDEIFLNYLAEERPFFSLKLEYRGDLLLKAELDGRELELFEVLNEDGSSAGRIKERSLVHRDGDWHGTVHTWIVRRRENEWELLFQKRSEQKESFPGKYDISSAGHRQAGEDARAAAGRELREELGLCVKPEDLEFLRLRKGVVQENFHGKPYYDREIASLYLYEKPMDTKKLVFQDGEVESVHWVSLKVCREEILAGDSRYCVRPDEIQMISEALEQKKQC